MNYQQQGQQLPFDPRNAQFQPIQFNQAPSLPNNLSVAPQLISYIPVVATMIANEASAGCNKNPGRMFLFNQLASNNYTNQDFVEAVQTALDMLLLGIMKNQYPNPNQGLADSVNKALIMCNAANFQKFPALQQHVDANLFNDAVRIVNTFTSIKSEIMQAKQNIMNSQQQQPMMGNGFNNGMNGSSNGFPTQQGGGFQASRMQPGMNVGNSSQVFHNNPQTPAAAPSMASTFNQEGRYDHLRASAATPVPMPVYPINGGNGQGVVNQNSFFGKSAQQTQSAQQVETIVSKDLVWKPCPAQWHPATCNTRTEKLILREIKWADDNVYVVSVAVNLTEEEMEEAKHQIGFTDQALMNTTPGTYGSRQEAIVDNIDAFVERNKVVREKPTQSEDEVDAFSVANSARPTVCSNFLAEAIFKGRVKMKKELQQTENDLSAFGVNVILSTPVLVDDPQDKLMEQLYDCTTYLRLQAVLKNALTNKSGSSVSKELVSRINKMFTKEVNSILNNRLSLDVNIDSFVDDISELITHLKNNEGEIFSTAFLTCQEEFINTYLNQVLVDDDLKEQTNEYLQLEIEDEVTGSKYAIGDRLPVALMTQYLTLTFLQVQSTDLSISRFGKIGTEVLMSKNPELFKLAKEMIDEEETKVIPVSHRFLITSDNVIYEFHKGLINKDFITISRYH